MISNLSKKGTNVYSQKYGNGQLYARDIENDEVFLVRFMFQTGYGELFVHRKDLRILEGNE